MSLLGSIDDAVVQLVPLAMKLFHKMVDTGAAFHLTLLNVCFSNLQIRGPAASGKGSITSFFTHSTSPTKTQTLSSQNQVVNQVMELNLFQHYLALDDFIISIKSLNSLILSHCAVTWFLVNFPF